MSHEVFELVQGMDFTDIEMQLAMQCAPVIMGLKISNLLIISNENVDKVRGILDGTNLLSRILLVKEKKSILLVYQQERFLQYFSQEEIRKLLRRLGYRKMELEELLLVFCGRYADYCRCGGNFPHEMGLLLGYPIEDVTGFIENNGKNFLYTGYWKVYQNIGEKIHLFRQFELAKETIIQLIAMGVSIKDVIRKAERKLFW